jgi:microcystin-dependent protein
MSEGFIGEIRIFAGSFAPAGWVFCDGQLMPISENDALFTLIGTTYGGDGQSTFGIPDLRGRVPQHQGAGGGSTYVLGEQGGVESVTLTAAQIPAHNHAATAATTGQVAGPSNAILAKAQSSQTGVRIYSTNATTTTMNPASITPAGGSQPHSNIQPSLGLNFILSLYGIFPRFS